MINTREAAIRVLSEVQDEGRFSNKVLQEYSQTDMSLEDKRLLRELVYGVLENRMYIDSIIKSASNVRMKKIHPMILQILRVGIYQIGFMDRIPAHAAINESVKLAKKYGHKGTIGYVNGVLRKIDRERDMFFLSEIPKNMQELSVRYSHPVFLVDLWIKQFGFEFTKELLEANNTKPLLNIRVNTLKIDRESLLDKLSKYDLQLIRGELSRDCIKVVNPENITDSKEFRDGFFTIQDESSMLVTEISEPNEKELVLDVCSAPGGKATHMAQRMNDNGKIIARDLYTQKINLIIENCKRLGINIVEGQVYDAAIFDESLRNKVDVCLVDAPCSGFGLLRRKPDIKFNRNKEDLDTLVEIQSKILNNSAGYVKSGGKLIYSTCTLNKNENLDQVQKFLDINPDFSLEPIDLPEDIIISKTQKEGYIELYPHIHGTDGFFIAKMIRK